MQKNKPIMKLRSVVKCGPSYYISLPKEFVDRHKIEKGEKLPVLGDQILKIIPLKEE
jgi:hypothetical protein